MIGRMIGAAGLKAETFEEIERDKGATIQALLVVILVSIAGLVGSMLGGEDFNIVWGLVFAAVG